MLGGAPDGRVSLKVGREWRGTISGGALTHRNDFITIIFLGVLGCKSRVL